MEYATLHLVYTKFMDLGTINLGVKRGRVLVRTGCSVLMTYVHALIVESETSLGVSNLLQSWAGLPAQV